MITLTQQSKETVARLIRKEFDTCTQYWLHLKAKELIQTAREFGLSQLADEMQNDWQFDSKRHLS